MKTYVKVIYGIALILSCIMIALFYICENTDENIVRSTQECRVLTDYEVTSYEVNDSPMGVMEEYKLFIEDITEYGNVIAFYVIHQEIEVYIGEEMIYSLKSDSDNVFSKTIGCDWVKTYLYPEDAEKEIRILVYPIYESSVGKDLTIYYGNNALICRKIVNDSLAVLILGMIAIVIGACFIIFRIINYKNTEFDNGIAIIGIFSLATGLWKVTDTEAAPLIFNNSTALSAIAIISISIMLISYVMYIRRMVSVESYKFWNILCVITDVSCIIIVLLQLSGIADLRQTLIFCHIMTVITMGMIIYKLLWNMFLKKGFYKLKMTVYCCSLCIIGCFADLIVYYFSGSSGSMIYGIFAFLIYIILMGYASLKDAITLIEKGKKARFFERLAMHDELSGLYNRAFYARYLESHSLLQADAYIIMFDVNNLKQCNDMFGHECGDKLIKNSAGIIQDVFLPEGKSIRIGGDEFCVILDHSDESFIKQRLKKLDELLFDFNKTHPDQFPIKIAHGYANYNADTDYDFSDTLRRADKNMYRMKSMMKQGMLEK